MPADLPTRRLFCGGARACAHVLLPHFTGRYKKIKKQCEEAGNCQMGSFTRLLHTGQPDDLMNEIPTWVAQPLPAEHPDHGYGTVIAAAVVVW